MIDQFPKGKCTIPWQSIIFQSWVVFNCPFGMAHEKATVRWDGVSKQRFCWCRNVSLQFAKHAFPKGINRRRNR